MGNIFSQNKNSNIINSKVSQIIKQQYFSTINQILRNNYNQGYDENRIKNNMKICLEKKSFDDFYDNEEIINPSYINWIDYLYNYLSIEQNDKEWASEMILKLDEEPFLTENKYLSHFFYKEFFLNTEPSCLNESKEENINNNDSLDMGNEKDLRTSMDNTNLMRNLGGTFYANANNEFDINSNNSKQDGEKESENETEKKYKLFRKKVKKYIFIFRQHIVYKDHPINKVIQLFDKSWVKYVEKKIEFLDNFDDNENNNYNKNYIIDELTKELQNFVIKMQICLKLFYCRAIDFSCFDNEKDELINLLTTLIFRTGKIYDTIFKIQQLKLQSISEEMESKYNQLKEITPQQLGIETQFCLNEETFNMQEEILIKEEKEFKGNDENVENLDKKGVAQFYLTDEVMDKRKIQSLLADIKNKKIKIEKNNQNFINNNKIKVNIDFDNNDNNLLLTQSYYNKSGILYDDNNIGSLYSQRGSLLSLTTEKKVLNIDGRKTIDERNQEMTNNLYNNLNKNDYNENQNDNNLIIRDNNNNTNSRKTIAPFNFVKIFNRISFLVDDPDKSGEFVSFPYETAIELLKQIQKYKAPFEKMLIFASLGNEIKNCIDDFWKDMEDYITSDLLGIEAEQLMTIFIYIITKAKIKDIIVHCKLIQLFTTSMTKSSMIGYYYSNAEASVTYIQSIKNVKDLLKGKNRIFDNSNNE